jgi:hypothetical protein
VKTGENNNQLCFYTQGQGETTPTLVPITTMRTTDEKRFQFNPNLLKQGCVGSPFQNREVWVIISLHFWGLFFSYLFS